MISAKVEWLVGSDKALAEVGTKATQKNILKRTLTKPAESLRDYWKSLAPRLTGHYSESITVGTNAKLTRRQKGSAYKAGALGVVELHIGTADPAGVQEEFGNAHQVANPSARPAWDAKKGEILTGIGTGLWVEIKKAADRAARKRAKV